MNDEAFEDQAQIESESSERSQASRRELIESALQGKQERVRDPDTGRFSQEEQSVMSAVEKKAMPRSWKADYSPKWDAIDPEIANFIAELEDKREKDVLAGVEKYKSLSSYAEGLRDVISPYEAGFIQNYGSVQNGIKTLIELSDTASRDPYGFAKWFIQQRQLDPKHLFQQDQGQAEKNTQGQPHLDEQTQRYFQSMLQPWLQKVSGLESQLQQFQSSQQATKESQSLKTVNDFFSGLEGEKIPVPDEAMDDFCRRVQFIRHQNPDADDRTILESAYNEFVWTNEPMRQMLLKKQENDKLAKQKQELAAKKAAAVSVKGSPSATPVGNINPKDRRALIEKIAAGFG